MSKPRRVHDGASRLLAIIFGLLLTIELAFASFIWRTESVLRRAEVRLVVADGLRQLAEQYARTSYLAVLELSAQDWGPLLEQRKDAEDLAAHFLTSCDAIMRGGTVQGSAGEIVVEPSTSPETRELLAQAEGLWKEARSSQVRLLRSDNPSLKNNRDLDEFNVASRELMATLDKATSLIRRDTDRDARTIGAAQRASLLALTLLTVALAVLVFTKAVKPLTMATRELRANLDELRETQSMLLKASRQAGMAELATGVLHNVGNALNSVNVSSELIEEKLRSSRVSGLKKAADMLASHRDDLKTFFSEGHDGPSLADYIGQLSERLGDEHDLLLVEVGSLRGGLEHAKVIIAHQQSLAKAVAVTEIFDPAKVLDETLNIARVSFERGGIELIRDYEPGETMTADRNKVMQILLNLVSNARHAVLETRARGDGKERHPRIRVELRRAASDISITIEDNGVGIPEENMQQIFTHGFTTKVDGHGFGLHSSVLAAGELGGRLDCESLGVGNGARFTLVLPATSRTT